MNLTEIFLGSPTAKEQIARTQVKQSLSRSLSAGRKAVIEEANHTLRRLLIRRLFLAGGYLVAVSTGAAALWRRFEQEGENSKPKKVVNLMFSNKSEKSKVDIVIFETQRPFDFDPDAFSGAVNLIASREGRLPPYSDVILSDKTIQKEDPGKFGATDPRDNRIWISIKDGLMAPPIHKLYPPEAIVNGVLVGEITNLMLSESGNLPSGAQHLERLGDSTGVMACAIFSGRSYAQYRQDTQLIEYLGPGGLIIFDENTYKEFQATLKPSLKFK